MFGPSAFLSRDRLLSIGALTVASSGLIAAAPSAPQPYENTPATAFAAPVPAPAAMWTTSAVRALRTEIRASAAEGLRPADYGLAELDRATASGDAAAIDRAASTSVLALAHDYAQGRISDRRQFGWLIERSPYELNDLPQRMADAVARDDVKGWLRSLLPTDERYVALRTAYAGTDDPAEVDRLRANMERWRWMPRSMGDRYIYVNVPSYRLAVRDNGVTLSSYTVVVGSPKTPTPQLFAPANSVVVNPTWTVPQSIIKSSNLRPGKAGYIFKANATGYTVTQPAGPKNSLGRVKIDMPNAEAIYLHDTPAKSLFARDERAFSHGCIRVQNIAQLADDLLRYGDGSTDRLESALGTLDTTRIAMPKQWPVYIVYFTADVDDGGRLVTYSDPYGRDAALIAALDDGAIRPMTVALR